MQTNYGIYFNGPASTPNEVGLINWSNMEVIHRVSLVHIRTGKATRARYEKIVSILKRKYPFVS